jgi:hypothetical protein
MLEPLQTPSRLPYSNHIASMSASGLYERCFFNSEHKCNPVSQEFLSFPDGDTVLTSSDEVEFRVDSLVLRRASPLFADMFKLPVPVPVQQSQQRQPALHVSPSKPPIIVDESAAILHDLLRLIYPPTKIPTISSPKHARTLFRALKKYQVSSDAFMTSLTAYVGTLDPALRAWALAVELGNEEARKMAFRRFIEQKSDPLDDDAEQLSRVEGRSVQRLFRIRRDVIAYVSKEVNRFFHHLICCKDHQKSILDFRNQAASCVDQLNIPTEEVLKAFSLCCGSCTANFHSTTNQALRGELRSYIEEILQGAVRQETNERTPLLKIKLPAIPTRLLEAEAGMCPPLFR